MDALLVNFDFLQTEPVPAGPFHYGAIVVYAAVSGLFGVILGRERSSRNPESTTTAGEYGFPVRRRCGMAHSCCA
jgi:hypothetical protein